MTDSLYRLGVPSRLTDGFWDRSSDSHERTNELTKRPLTNQRRFQLALRPQGGTPR